MLSDQMNNCFISNPLVPIELLDLPEADLYRLLPLDEYHQWVGNSHVTVGGTKSAASIYRDSPTIDWDSPTPLKYLSEQVISNRQNEIDKLLMILVVPSPNLLLLLLEDL